MNFDNVGIQMANYDEWNKAIAEYFVSGLSSGATVYLSVDEGALMNIGTQFEQSEANHVDWVEDFKKAVQSECVIGNQVYLEWVAGYLSDRTPRCVAFLAAMVLAAHHMVAEEVEDEIIASSNYFKRLRQVLGLPAEDGGRPDGLQTGVEEKLWLSWNRWLIQNGLLPSAERGESINYAYVNYPLSQALLREADKKAMERLFRERENLNQLSRVWDRDIVGSWVRMQQFNSKYLRELVQENDRSRYEAITDAIYDVYSSIDWDQDMPQHGSRSTFQRRLTAQLYRNEDPIMGYIDYYLYPRQPKQFSGGTLNVIQNGCAHPLIKDRPGWFLPLWPENPAGGASYAVIGHPQIKELVLPERGFWVLISDPENESSGVFGGWGYPGVGETFLLLCRKEYADQMEIFRQEALLKWDHEFSINEEWMEYRECMIISPSWEGIIPQYQDLYNALKPTATATTISLKGGLRVPNQGGWLEGYAPEMTIFAFDDSVKLKLLDISCPDEFIIDEIVNTNKPVSLPPLSPGDYLFETYTSGRLATRRALRILPWDSLDCRQPEQPFNVDVGTFTLQGAIFKVTETDRQEDQ